MSDERRYGRFCGSLVKLKSNSCKKETSYLIVLAVLGASRACRVQQRRSPGHRNVRHRCMSTRAASTKLGGCRLSYPSSPSLAICCAVSEPLGCTPRVYVLSHGPQLTRGCKPPTRSSRPSSSSCSSAQVASTALSSVQQLSAARPKSSAACSLRGGLRSWAQTRNRQPRSSTAEAPVGFFTSRSLVGSLIANPPASFAVRSWHFVEQPPPSTSNRSPSTRSLAAAIANLLHMH